jgi:hypothetical protein
MSDGWMVMRRRCGKLFGAEVNEEQPFRSVERDGMTFSDAGWLAGYKYCIQL